jgi:hypothetical protein
MVDPLEKSMPEACLENTLRHKCSVNSFQKRSLQPLILNKGECDNMLEGFEVLFLAVQELEGELQSLSDNTTALTCKNDFPVVRAVFMIRTKNGLKRGQMLSGFSHSAKIDQLSVGKHYRFTAAVNEHEDKLMLFYLPSRTIFVDSNTNGELTI